MAKYRKLPVEIDAVPAGDVIDAISSGTLLRLEKWINDAARGGDLKIVTAYEPQHPYAASDGRRTVLHVTTLEGVHYVERGDMLIRGVRGELYGCKPDIFDSTYESVPSP